MKTINRLVLLIFSCGLITSVLFWNKYKEPYSAERIVESLWEKFEVQSTQVGEEGNMGEEEFVIRIDVYDKKDIANVEKYLVDHLSKKDLTKYNINVFSNKGITY